MGEPPIHGRLKPKITMKLKISHCENSSQVHFSDWDFNFYFLTEELRPLAPFECRVIRDLSRHILAETWKMQIIHVSDTGGRDGALKTDGYVLYVDTNKLFRHILTLREKKLEATMDIERLRTPVSRTQMLTFTQMCKHANARSQFSKTIKYFHDRLKPDQWPRLIEVLSRYLPVAVVFCHGDEFYFDGRRLQGGVGFNGGIILHGDEFGVHT